MEAIAYIDGASLQNPTYAALAFRIYNSAGELLLSVCEPIGKQTNNFAEYYALLRCLQEAHRMGIRQLTIYTDAELLHKQWIGECRVNSENLRPLYTEAKELARQFESVQVNWVRSGTDECAKVVDRMAREAAEHVKQFGLLHEEVE